MQTINYPILQQNIKSLDEYVKILQTHLTEKGYYRFAIDGDFRERTFGAVCRFQRDNGIEVTGVVQEETWAKILD